MAPRVGELPAPHLAVSAWSRLKICQALLCIAPLALQHCPSVIFGGLHLRAFLFLLLSLALAVLSIGCADSLDLGETSYAQVLADDLDGNGKLDLLVRSLCLF